MRPGQVVHLPPGAKVLGMTTVHGNVMVATTEGVFRITEDGQLEPVLLPSQKPPRRRLFQFRGFWSRVWDR